MYLYIMKKFCQTAHIVHFTQSIDKKLQLKLRRDFPRFDYKYVPTIIETRIIAGGFVLRRHIEHT